MSYYGCLSILPIVPTRTAAVDASCACPLIGQRRHRLPENTALRRDNVPPGRISFLSVTTPRPQRAQAPRTHGPLPFADELGRQALYHSLSKQGNPELETLTRVLRELGFRLAVEGAA